MSILIPNTRVAGFALLPRLFSGEQEGALGGPDLPLPRMGDRWSASVRTAQFRLDAAGRDFLSALTLATTGDARMVIQQPHVPQLASGSAPAIEGSGQAGSAVTVRGIPAGTVLERGRYFSVLHLGIHHVHMIAEATVVGSAPVRLAIWPMLRFLTLDGERVYFDVPMIEGRLAGFDARGGQFVRNRIEAFEFQIVERS